MSNLYESPKYYEIAFSFRDIKSEVDTLEQSIERFSKISVKCVLEIGCGNSPHMAELVKRDYDYYGIDLSKAMIEYSQEKAKNLKGKVNLICGDMFDFRLDNEIDFAYVMLDSIYAKDNQDFKYHFDCISKALKSGGLYFMDWCVEFNPLETKTDEWEMEQNGIKVKTRYAASIINKVNQTYEESILLDIDDNGQIASYIQKSIRKAVYPQEFLLFLSSRNDFEFIGWWNNWDLDCPLDGNEEINRPIIIIRKK